VKKGKIETFLFESVDESAKSAIATTYKESSGTIQKEMKLIYKKEGKVIIKDL